MYTLCPLYTVKLFKCICSFSKALVKSLSDASSISSFTGIHCCQGKNLISATCLFENQTNNFPADLHVFLKSYSEGLRATSWSHSRRKISGGSILGSKNTAQLGTEGTPTLDNQSKKHCFFWSNVTVSCCQLEAFLNTA